MINGVFTGGNCPLFYLRLKNMGHEVKIIDATYFRTPYNKFSELLDAKDIIIPSYNLFDYICFKIYQRLRLNFLLITIAGKLSEIIRKFKTDLIINHQTSIRANLIARAGFHPVINYIYGSEIKGDNIHSPMLKRSFDYSDLTLTTITNFRNRILGVYPDLQNKIRTRSLSYYSTEELENIKSSIDYGLLRENSGIGQNEFLIFDNRTLRDPALTKIIVAGFIKAASLNNKLRFVLIRGFSGKAGAVTIAHELLSGSELADRFIVIDKELTYNEHFGYILASDAITSFLPDDQFGEIIIHGMYFKKALILYRLEQYLNILNSEAEYIDHLTEDSVCKGLLNLYNNQNKIDRDANYRKFIECFDMEKGFAEINITLTNLVYEFNKIT